MSAPAAGLSLPDHSVVSADRFLILPVSFLHGFQVDEADCKPVFGCPLTTSIDKPDPALRAGCTASLPPVQWIQMDTTGSLADTLAIKRIVAVPVPQAID
jgi:hypothetical protein